MAAKRDHESMAECDTDQSRPIPSSKRARNSNGQRKTTRQQHQQEPPTDVTYGQRCCFPGLNETLAQSDDDLDFEDETDALAYLHSVRQQASTIPHLLVAPRSGPQLPPARAADEPDHDDGIGDLVDRGIYSTGYGDTRGYYRDGAYTAAPDDDGHADVRPGNNDDEIGAAYLASLASHFLSLRTRLHRSPPPAVLASLAGDRTPHVGPFGRGAYTFSVWSARVARADPHPAQIAAMGKGEVLRLLRVILGAGFLRSGTELRERTSRWLWALLARLPDRGELDHAEVGHVRELGKRAALLMHTLREMALLREEVELGFHDEDADADAEEWMGEDEDGDEEVAGSDPRDNPAAEAKQHAACPHPTSDPVRSSSTAPNSVPEADSGDVEEGEIANESAPADLKEDIESAKARLLTDLGLAGASSSVNPPAAEPGTKDTARHEVEAAYDPVRARMNMRATLNMILTVAGEFYGQRDLLEFRDPFRGV